MVLSIQIGIIAFLQQSYYFDNIALYNHKVQKLESTTNSKSQAFYSIYKIYLFL